MGTKNAWAIAPVLALLTYPALLTVQPELYKLSPIGEPALIVDPACTQCDGGVLDLYLKNDNAGKVSLLLTVGNLVNKTSKKPINATISWELLKPETKAPFGNRKSVDSGEMLLLRLKVANVMEEGEWEAKLYNRGIEFGSFTVIRYHLPFNVRLDVAKPDDPELLFRLGEPMALPLRNDDDIAYCVGGELTLKGQSLRLEGTTLPPKGAVNPTIPPKQPDPDPWFNDRKEGMFRDETVEGRLVMTLRKAPYPQGECKDQPASADAFSKVIKVTVHLSYYGRLGQFVAIFGLLFAGALCSLYLHSYFPNQVRRIGLRKDLDQLNARVRDLPMKLASRLRVSLGVEANRLLELLNSSSGITPGFPALVTEVKQRIERLQKRLELVEELGRSRLRFEAERSKRLFPTPMDNLADEFERAGDLLRKVELSDLDSRAAEDLLKDIGTHIENLEDIEKFCARQHDQVRQITLRALGLLRGGRNVQPSKHLDWPADQPKGQNLYQHMFDRLDELRKKKNDAAQADKPSPEAKGDSQVDESFRREDLPDVDRLGTKMEMLLECARLEHGQPHLTKLANLLICQNSEEFEAAKRLLKEIKEIIFSDEVEEKITSRAERNKIPRFRDWGEHPSLRRLVSVLSPFLWVSVALLFCFGHWKWGLALLLILSVGRTVAGPDLLTVFARWVDRWSPRFNKKVNEENVNEEEVNEKDDPIFLAEPRDVRIQVDTNEVRTYQPVQLSVKFCKEQFNAAGALEDITPIWDFGHDELTPEEGWEVVHYFPRARRYVLMVHFRKRLGDFVTHPKKDHSAPAVYVKHEINAMSETGVTLWALSNDVVWLLIALVPALLVLYAGAIDQLQKLDFVPALIAIFTLGFGSDQVKNLFVQKPQ